MRPFFILYNYYQHIVIIKNIYQNRSEKPSYLSQKPASIIGKTLIKHHSMNTTVIVYAKEKNIRKIYHPP